MLRITVEVLPDHMRWNKNSGRIIRIIDIKEQDGGSYLEGSYKTKFYKTPGALINWKFDQVNNVKKKEYCPERLIRDAIDKWLNDREAQKEDEGERHHPPD